MLNRRHIRIKVMQILYAFKGTESDDLKKDERFLLQSMDKMHDLYYTLLWLMVEVQKKAVSYSEKAQKKHLATTEEKNPNRKFINNELIAQLANNVLVMDALEERSLNCWELDDEYVDIIFRKMLESELYKDYMSTRVSTYNEDKQYVIDLFKEIIAPNDKLYSYLEDKNITWIDDLPVVNTTIVKLLRKSKANSAQSHFTPKLFKDVDDRDFAINLMKKSLLNLSSLNTVIAGKTTNWDQDRIAKLDLVLLQLGICELQHFPSIPTKVTINEYIEIAKEYSTPKSSVFINGVLDKIVKEYQAKGTLNKIGRGLM